MSSLLDAVIQSDGPSSTPAPRPRGGREAPSSQIRSSSRPRALPSESAGHLSDYDDLEDEIAVAQALRRERGAGRQRSDVPKISDLVGEQSAVNFQGFLENFVEDVTPSGAPRSSTGTPATDKYYIEQIRGMRIYNLSTLYVDYLHVLDWEGGRLATAIAELYYRLTPYLTMALNNVIQKYEPRYFRDHRQPDASSTTNSSVAANAQSQGTETARQTRNQQTDKIFTIAFYNLPVVSRIRQLRTEQIGKLLSISGTVTRTSEVRPELYMGTFICEFCGNTVHNVEQTFRYSEPVQCPNTTCNNTIAWRLDIAQSTFVDWQKIRVQENSAEIPTGSMPRTMDVIVRGEIVDRAKAGEKCVFTGTLIVIPDTSQFRVPGQTVQATKDNSNMPRGGEVGGSGVSGLRVLGVRDLTYRMAFLSSMITPDTTATGAGGTRQRLAGQANNILASLNQTADSFTDLTGKEAQQLYLDSLTSAEIDDLRMMVNTDNLYERLVQSLAPMVYGHDVVKKGLLLQLLGGVSKQTPENMALRGDINICVVGDPSTSKSQFLKYICSLIPRAVYTSGKASSAAGLTAAVVKDEETGDFTIEAGALMLADNGICAIDEFDKMDISDQVAIHEAMEQQTISIAKAGIQATLNARTSILAAANPVGGRYNRKTTLRANINMSAPIMSRFDLFFVILDECNESVDRHLAEHIVAIHRDRDEAVQPFYSTEQLQRFIRFARTFKPQFTPEAKTLLVAKYKELRQDDAQGGVGRNSYRITVRQLESMIRLSEAIAKAKCKEFIEPNMVLEAFHLLRQSIISVEKDDVDVDDEPEPEAEDVAEDEEETVVREKTKITYDKYMSMLKAIIGRLRQAETDAAEGVEEQDLIIWYLEGHEEEFDDEAQMEAERDLLAKVIRRMVKDNVLMLIRGEGLADQDGEGLDEERVVYVIHPNYSVD